MGVQDDVRSVGVGRRVAALAGGLAVTAYVAAGVAGAQLAPVAPDSSVPGGNAFGKLLAWGMYVALACSVLAILAGAAMWGFSSTAGPMGGHEGTGKMMVLGGVVGALFTGLAVAIVNGVFTAVNSGSGGGAATTTTAFISHFVSWFG